MKQASNQSLGKKTALGAAAALAVYLALAALLSLLVVRGTAAENGIAACVWAFAAIAAFTGAKIASWRAADPLAPTAFATAAFWALVVLLGFLTNDTLEPARVASLALSSLLGGALAYMLRGGGKKRGGHKRRSRK